MLKALERDPARRYATARELGRALLAHATRDGTQVGLADLSAWLEHLFPNGRRERASLAAVAAQVVETRAMNEATRHTATRQRRRRTILVAGMVAVAAAGGLVAGVLGAQGASEGDGERAQRAQIAPDAPPRVEAIARTPAEPPVERETAPAVADAGPGATVAVETVEPRDAVVRRAQGTVQVATPGGWATVRLRGRVLGNTPLRAELPAGTHVLQVSPYGRGPVQRVTVRVRAGEVVRVRHPIRAE